MNPAMLADAVRSELYRLFRNRMAVFWSAMCVPLVFAIGGIGFHFLTRSRTQQIMGDLSASGAAAAMSQTPVDFGRDLLQYASVSANGAMLAFMLVGAATLYAGDYRWETWRLTSARNDRINLILGKVGAFKILTLIAITAFFVAGMVFSTSQGLINGQPFAFTFDGGDGGAFALTLLLSYIRIVQYAMIALLTAVLTRSLLATLFVPVVLGFGQSLLGGPGLALLGWEPVGWPAQLALPGLAYDTLKAAVADNPGAPPLPDGVTVKAGVSLLLWAVLPLVGALAWFQRQDLSKE